MDLGDTETLTPDSGWSDTGTEAREAAAAGRTTIASNARAFADRAAAAAAQALVLEIAAAARLAEHQAAVTTASDELDALEGLAEDAANTAAEKQTAVDAAIEAGESAETINALIAELDEATATANDLTQQVADAQSAYDTLVAAGVPDMEVIESNLATASESAVDADSAADEAEEDAALANTIAEEFGDFSDAETELNLDTARAEEEALEAEAALAEIDANDGD
jgi:hypothetical protein